MIIGESLEVYKRGIIIIYAFDIDGTICTQHDGAYQKAKPFKDRIKKINQLYDEGHTIYFFTARGATTGIDWTNIIKNQFKKWKVKYHKIWNRKPTADLYIDDKGIKDTDFFKIEESMKQAIVTGSEGGIGKAIVKALKEANFKVEGIDIKKKQDVCDYNILKDIINRYNRIDCLVNCAGVTFKDETSESYSREKWDKIIEINLTAPFVLSQLVFPKMKKNGGSIINITSIWAERVLENNPGYGASKGGLKILTKCLAKDWAKFNIRVNSIGLGIFKTDMTSRTCSSKKRLKRRLQTIPLNRIGKPKEVGGTVVFLATDASSYMTGADLYIDGGWIINGD